MFLGYAFVIFLLLRIFIPDRSGELPPLTGKKRNSRYYGVVNFEGNADSHGLCDVGARLRMFTLHFPVAPAASLLRRLFAPMLSAMFGETSTTGDGKAQVYDAAIKILMRAGPHSVHEMKKSAGAALRGRQNRARRGGNGF